ncbi:MAG: hypothetical protein QHH75_05835 [Bacillota bacterium]|nr:hypothetical protein [Bacillota bacterium]
MFGYYGYKENYRVLTEGTKVQISKWMEQGHPVVGENRLNFPFFVKDGIPMVGINSVDDVTMVLLASFSGHPRLDRCLRWRRWLEL